MFAPPHGLRLGLAASAAVLAIMCLGLTGCAHLRRERPPPARTDDVANGPAGAEEPDGDGDNIPDACDRCPQEMETYNGALDLDGCPDNSGVAHLLALHPTHRFGSPIVVVEFDPDSSVVSAEGRRAAERPVFVESINDRSPLTDLLEAEEGACVGTREGDEPMELARARAEALCALLAARGFPSDLLTIRAAEDHPVLVEAELNLRPINPLPPRGGAWVVTRGDGVDVWRWAGRSFERVTPRAEPVYDPPLTEECRYDGRRRR